MSQTKGLRLLAYDARRIVQTTRTFANWPALLRQMIAERVGNAGAEDTLTFTTKAGLQLSCPNVPGARLPMYEQFADDCYDLKWLLGPDSTAPLHVLDVGSHVGAFATNLATARADVTVECYEPSPETALFLRRNVTQNRLSDRVRVHELAMSGTVGEALLDDNSGGSVHNGLVKADHRLVDGDDAIGRRGTIAVATTTFDLAVQTAPAPFTVVKMDCEGGEYDLVYRSTPSSWASVQRVVMEYHPVHGESWSALRSWFADVGFTVVRHTSDRPGLGTAWLQRAGD